MSEREAGSARRCFGKPLKVLELAALATIISPSILVITTAGTSQVLAQEGSAALPLVYILLAVISIPLASGISAALGRWRTSQICRSVCWASLLVCLALRAAVALDVSGTSQAICISAYVLEILFDTLFWLTVSEYLTTSELKRHTPFLAMAFGLGGIFGGLLATGFCEWLPADDLLLLNAAMFGLCLVQFMRIDRKLQSFTAEADDEETGIVSAVRSTFVVLRAFPLTGVIAVGIFLMSSLFCLQDYLALTIYAENTSDEDSLASFMGTAYAGQQAAELLILAVFGRLVLEGSGPLVRNLFFPLTTVGVLLALQSFWLLPIAVLVHVNANSVSNAIFEPVKNLNYAALPFRMLAPVRMLVEGVVYPAGVALSGGALLWMQATYQPNTILAVAIVLSVLFTAISSLVGIAFLPSLLRSLRLRAVSPLEYSNREPGRLFSPSDVRYLMSHSDPEARDFGRNLARTLAPNLLAAEESRARRWGVPTIRVPRRWRSAQALSPQWLIAPALSHGNGDGLSDSVGADCPYSIAEVMSADQQDRAVALSVELAELARGLEHPSFSARRNAARLLSLNGDAAVAVAARKLNSERPEVVEAAIQTLGAIRTRKARRVLRDYLRPLYRQARLNLAGIQALQHLAAVPVPANARDDLAEGLADSNRRILRKVLAVKSALGNRRDINLLHSLAQTPEPRVRSDAVEALTSLPTGRLIRPVLPLLGFDPDCMRDNPTLSRAHRAKPADPAAAVRKAAKADPWLRVLAARVLGDDEGRARKKEDGLMLNLVLFLKSVPLFRALSFEDIARVAKMTETVSVAEGEVLFRSGESVTHIHVVRSGSVELVRNGMIVDILKTGMSIGEYAIFGHTQHEVSAEASADCRLLRFPVGLLADIVAEHPHSLGPIAGDLIRRVHLLYTYLAEMRKLPAQDTPVAPAAMATGAPSIDRIVMA